MEKIYIHTPYIELPSLLKMTGVLETGGQIRYLLDEGRILLNQQVVTEKRKKVYPGHVVEVVGIGVFEVEQDENHGN